MSARKTFTEHDIAQAREILADYEETMPIDLAVEVVTKAAVIRELQHLLAVRLDHMDGLTRSWIRQRIRTLGGDPVVTLKEKS